MPSTARRPQPRDYRQHLEVETPEHVVLDLEVAGIGSRGFAALVDSAILAGGTFAGMLLLVLLGGFGIELGGWGMAIVLFVFFAAWNGYYILFEGLRRGQTPGKRLAGIRVVRDTGHAVTVGAAVARNLLRLADFLPPPYLSGTLLIAFHPRAKRLGDMVAGTVVVRDRPAEATREPHSVPLEPTTALPQLTDDEFRLLTQYQARAASLPADAAGRLAAALAGRFAGRTPVRPRSDVAFLLQLHAAELARRQGPGARAQGSTVNRFAARQRPRWDEFQRLAERAARHGLDSFAAHELPDFAARYREVAADLARARTYGADDATRARLERLVAAGHNALYRDERHTGRRIWAVVARECPAAVLQARSYVLIACLAFVAPAAAGFLVLHERPALAAELLPDVVLRRAEAGETRVAAGQKYVTVDPAMRPMMASGIITNNVRVALACFAGGVFLGVGALVLLAYNGLAIGATMGHFANAGLLGYLLEFVTGHGALELFAIWVAGAAGFLLGRSIVAPGELTRADALVLNGQLAIRMVGAAAVMLVVAGLIEGFLSAGDYEMPVRLGASAASLGFLALYLFSGRGTRPAE